ncbi:hypothetical protein GCM10027048_06070 [Hymenobacter coalescens]
MSSRFGVTLLVAATCSFNGLAQGHQPDLMADSAQTSSIYCGPLVSPDKPIKSLAELPDNVRYKLTGYMNDWLGEAVYLQVRFLEGRAVDVDSLLKQRNDIQWTVCSYYLCFAFQDAVAQVGLDKWGQTLNELTLPDVRRYPDRAGLISKAAALQMARRRGVIRRDDLPESISTELSYASEPGILRWIITVRRRKTDYASDIQRIVLNAHNGAVLRIRKYEERQIF